MTPCVYSQIYLKEIQLLWCLTVLTFMLYFEIVWIMYTGRMQQRKSLVTELRQKIKVQCPVKQEEELSDISNNWECKILCYYIPINVVYIYQSLF